MGQMDDWELMDTVVFVDPFVADQERLPCLYCCGAEMIPHERIRAWPHRKCLRMVEEYMAEQANDGTGG